MAGMTLENMRPIVGIRKMQKKRSTKPFSGENKKCNYHKRKTKRAS